METPSQHTPAPPPLPGEGEERVTRILESISDAFCAYDSDWRIIYLNEAARKILLPIMGDPEKMLGRSHWDVFPATAGTLLEREFRRAVEEERAVEFDYYYTDWKRWFILRGYPIRGGGLSVYFRDVTEEKRIAAALQTSEQRYRSLFNSIDEGFCIIEMIWDENGTPYDYRFVDVNQSFEQHSGLKDSVGKRMRELNPNHEERWFQIYGQVARSGQPTRFEEVSESLGRWFDVYAFPFDGMAGGQVAVRFADITAKRHAEKELSRLNLESSSRVAELETLLDVLPIGIGISLDRDCKNIRVNRAFAQVLGLAPELNASKTAPEEERPQNFRILDDEGQEVPGDRLPMQLAASEGRDIRNQEFNLVHADGRTLRLLEYAAPIFDEQGSPRGSVGAFVDITDRMQETARQRFLVALDDAVRPLGNPVEIVDTSARLLGQHLKVDRCNYAEVEADGKTVNILGDYTHGVPSLLGRYFFTRFGSDVLRSMQADVTYIVEDIEHHQPAPEDLAVYEAASIRALICVPLHKDGRFVAKMAVHQKTPRRWTQAEVGLVQHVANRCWEALERVRVTRELEESETRFRQIAEVTPQVVWLARPNGGVDYFNRRWYDFTGLQEGGGLDESWVTVLHPEDLPACLERWQHSIKTGEPYETRYRWLSASGHYRWFLGRALPLRDDAGHILRWYGTSTDIDDLVRAEETARVARAEAERANRAKDDFLAALSHELRTPLTPVLMAAESLSEDGSLDGTTRETLSMIQRHIALEARLIDDLLDITRISHGKLQLRLQEADAHTLIGLALEIVREEAQAKGLKLSIDFAARNTTLNCDPARLQQVFWNLLKNAVKFTPPQGRIRISTRDEGSRLVLEVSDSGIGIANEKLGRIFEPFEQAGLANDHRFGGLGLGLSISKALVEMHEGQIQAESAGPGQGSVFRILLPAMAADCPSQPALSTVGTASTGASQESSQPAMRLLLVEDHEPTLVVLARLLKRAGHEVITADSVATALEAAENHPFDAVVSDVGLPDGTGMDLMKILHTQHGLRGIALTGYGMEEDINRAHQSGFAVHLTKPVQFAQLRQALLHLSMVASEEVRKDG
ncbi:PAS domain S-box protein [Prosthecobacter sp. SYSU 5D2]|uniref:PAS domain S-box protein n=1 Tax=Prosthecobacter sp. SYSU 5D2 TaxID=3134134 RepID=UPI0031FF2270